MSQPTPLEFLQAVFPEPVQPGRLVLWSKLRRTGRNHSDWCCDLRHAARLIDRYRNTRDVYFGVALQDPRAALRVVRRRRPRATLATVRGGEATTTALGALWADVDVAGPGHRSQTLPPDRAAALTLFEAVPQPPSILVGSGGGFHAYWLLREPWIFESEVERRQARDLVRRLQWAIQQQAATRGWHVDHTADLARVLRVPGTYNYKGAGRLPVTLERFPLAPEEGRYSVLDFDDLPAAPERAGQEPPWAEEASGTRPNGSPEGPGSTGAPAEFPGVWHGCSWIRHCYRDRATLPEPEWYALLTILILCAVEGPGDQAATGRDLAQRFSRGHPGYSPEATDAKLAHAARAPGPQTCEHVAHKLGAWEAHCSRCPHFGKVRSPIVLGRGDRDEAPAPAAAARRRSLPVLPAEGGDGRPEIVVTTREKEVNDQVLAVLAGPDPGRPDPGRPDPDLFERGGLLVEVVEARDHEAPGPPAKAADAGTVDHPPGAPLVRPLQEARLREILAERCAFVTLKTTARGEVERRPVHPPRWTTRALLARGSWPRLPLLEGLVEGPVLRADGTVLQEPGYDPVTGLVYAPTAAFEPVPERPAEGDCESALDLLREVVCDFPFQAEIHFSAWLASLLTPLARPAFEGPSPLNLIDANTRGTGKSLLADVVSTVLTGRPAARMSYSRDEDEIRKAITGLALEGARLVLIDNVTGVFGSATLDRALTAWSWRDRLLGSNDHVELPLQVTWYATGNNVALHADTPRRCLHVRLESPEERPEERTVFRHPHLLPWIRRRRGRILPAALTLLRAYVVAGRPAQALPGLGSFEGWSELVRSAIAWLGLPDPALTRRDLELAAGNDVSVLAAFLDGLVELLDDLGGQATARRMVQTLADESNAGRFTALRTTLTELFPRLKPGTLPTPAQLGFKLRAYTGRIVEGRAIAQARKSTRGVTWEVRRTRAHERSAA